MTISSCGSGSVSDPRRPAPSMARLADRRSGHPGRPSEPRGVALLHGVAANETRSQVRPPSVVRKTPSAGAGPLPSRTMAAPWSGSQNLVTPAGLKPLIGDSAHVTPPSLVLRTTPASGSRTMKCVASMTATPTEPSPREQLRAGPRATADRQAHVAPGGFPAGPANTAAHLKAHRWVSRGASPPPA
jgi:hypothetical protein